MAYNHKKGWCWISNNDQIIFIAIPKNCSTSIRNTFDINNSLPEDYFTIEKSGYKSFTILRNPFERLISGYIEVCHRAYYDCPKTKDRDFFPIKNQKDRFYCFIDEIEKEFFDAHIEAQTYYLTDSRGNYIDCDFILIMENINLEFNRMCSLINIKKKLRHDNSKKINKKHLIKKIIKPFKSLLINKFQENIAHQTLPTKNEVIMYLNNDKSLIKRINKIYKNDWHLYNKLIQEENILKRNLQNI